MNLDDFSGKVVLITGGTGSFGRAFADRLIRSDCREIRIFSRDELKQFEMREIYSDPRVRYYIGDVRDFASIRDATVGAHRVFHAAALKQVPTCEFFPEQAIATNVHGSANVVRASIEAGVEAAVFLSTDKAVYPVNAMGMSKALMEKVVISAARSLGQMRPILSCVRYGNVLCSRGSIVPLVVSQIRASTPITVTHPGMTRFLLSLDEAIDLVCLAMRSGNQGDLLIRKARASTIIGLIEAVRSLLQSDTPLKRIGVRHGEKIHEVLATAEEVARAEDLGEHLRIPMDGRGLNYAQYFTVGETLSSEDLTSQNAEQLTAGDVAELLRTLPEFQKELN